MKPFRYVLSGKRRLTYSVSLIKNLPGILLVLLLHFQHYNLQNLNVSYQSHFHVHRCLVLLEDACKLNLHHFLVVWILFRTFRNKPCKFCCFLSNCIKNWWPEWKPSWKNTIGIQKLEYNQDVHDKWIYKISDALIKSLTYKRIVRNTLDNVFSFIFFFYCGVLHILQAIPVFH